MFKWIQRHKNIVFLIVVAAALIAILASSFAGNGPSDFGVLVQTVISEIQKPITQFGEKIESGAKGVFDFRATLEENQALRQRVEQLEKQVMDYKLTEAELEELKKLSLALHFESVQESSIKVVAKAISIDGFNHFSIFTIDEGARAGINKDAVVVNGQGVIGRVYEAGKNFSKVISIIDTNSNTSFLISRSESESYLGIAYGNGSGGLDGYMLDTNADVKEGDKLLTSGMGIYPQGLTLGKVTKVLSQKDSLLRYVEIEPAVDFKNISKLLVIVMKERL